MRLYIIIGAIIISMASSLYYYMTSQIDSLTLANKKLELSIQVQKDNIEESKIINDRKLDKVKFDIKAIEKKKSLEQRLKYDDTKTSDITSTNINLP
ncbi:MAG: hypothetical protein ACPG9K_01145 [Poseidonibacter sp.]